MLRLTRITATLIITLTVMITAARIIGAQAALPPITLNGGSEIIYVDVATPNTFRKKLPEPTPPEINAEQHIIRETALGTTEFILYFRHKRNNHQWYDLHVQRDNHTTIPFNNPVTLPENFHPPQDRLIYFLRDDESRFNNTLIKYYVNTGKTHILFKQVGSSHGCSQVDPNWCIIWRAAGLNYTLHLVNLSTGMTRYIAPLIPGENRYDSGWMSDAAVYVYVTRPVANSTRRILAYDPITDTHHLIAELPAGRAFIDFHSDSHRVFVLNDAVRNRPDDLLIIETDTDTGLPVVTTSVRDRYRDLQLKPFADVAWSPDTQRLVFVREQAAHTNLSALSLPDNILTPLTDFTDVNTFSVKLSPDGEWGAFIANHNNLQKRFLYLVPTDGHLPPRKIDAINIDATMQLVQWENIE